MDASIYCWGSTANGELGLGGIEQDCVLKPQLLMTFQHSNLIQDIICGRFHTVVLLRDGSVYSCGNNDFGQLGRPFSRKKLELVGSFGSHTAWQAQCGENHSVVVTTNGEVFSWGSNLHGQLGLSIQDEQISSPRIIKSLAVSHKVIQVSCGLQHTLALVETGQVYSFGQNKYGQLGIGYLSDGKSGPCLVSSIESLPIAQIAAGGYHSMALTKSGSIFSWGRNRFGQLGVGNMVDQVYPSLIKALKQQKVKYLCCGEEYSVALTNTGGVFTFGAGYYGQLGHGGSNNEVLPRQVIELMGSIVTQIAAGRCHTLAYIQTRGRIYAFGLNGNGQLGIGSIENWKSPILVQGPWVRHDKDSILSETSWYRPVSRLTRQLSQIEVSEDSKKTEQCSCDNDIIDDSAPMEVDESPLIIHKIISGGDHSFVISSDRDALISSQDFRFLPDDTQISTVQESVLEELKNVPEAGSVNLDHISHIESTFSSVACLNGSFLKNNLEHFGCTSRNCGVDFNAVYRCFECIRDAKNVSVPEVILNCLKDLIGKLPSSSPPECEALRVYLIIPFCHWFQDPATMLKDVILPYTTSVLRLGKNPSLVLEHWWKDLSSQHFKNFVSIFTKSVTKVIDKASTESYDARHLDDTKSLLEMLKKLNKVNIESNNKLPCQEFYIPKITEVIDVGEDYLLWLNSRDSNTFFFCDFPFVFDAPAKTMILQKESRLQMKQAFDSAVEQTFFSLILPTVVASDPFLILNIRRDKIVEDSLSQLMSKASTDLKKPLKVNFVGEEAIDGGGVTDTGGVTKEFFLLLLREVLDPKYGMFKHFSETNCIWFNDQSFEEDAMYYLIGIICGLAIYSSTIIDLPFPLALYKKLLSEPLKLEDLNGLSPIMAKSLQDLLDYQEEGDDFESIFCLSFSVSLESFGVVKTVDLKENGRNILVTKENRKEYVDCYVDFILNKSIQQPFEAFNSGFHKVCANRVLCLFHAQELMALVIGNEDYQFDELEANAKYTNEYNSKHPVIVRFWKVFHSLTLLEKKKFLLFLTGTDRIPILGISSIKLVIQPMHVNDSHLPVAHTCFNILDLPMYSTEKTLREKLLLAVENTHGFGLV